MATRWSSEFIVSEHRDLQASGMSVDSTGNFVLLAGKKSLGLKDLNKPVESLIKFPRNSKFDVGVAEWNPHSQHKELCAISCNQKVEVININTSNLSSTHTLTAHTRIVKDLNWHLFDPHLLASCSIDRFMYIWDLRDYRRPSVSFSSIVGPSQVKWNPFDGNVLATSHNGDVKIWDQRKGSAPVNYISAHEGNINCLDWSPCQQHLLATSGQDHCVKFFDTLTLKQEETMISCSAPIWRAKFTPFGNGMLVVVVPPRRRGDNSLLLWNLSSPASLVHTFLGHSDIVLEFGWRQHQTVLSNYQLITWSKDETLRLWQIETFLETMCTVVSEENSGMHVDESEESQTALEGTNLTNGYDGELSQVVEAEEMVASVETVMTESSISDQVTPDIQPIQTDVLLKEFSLINLNIPYLNFETIDPDERICTLNVDFNEYFVCLNMNFPLDYPNNSPPLFEFTNETNIDRLIQDKLIKLLKHIALQRVRKGKTCLEQCIKQLVSTLDQLHQMEDLEKVGNLRTEGNMVCKLLQDSFIPFPRLSGANFCNNGTLVCFGRKVTTKSVESETISAPAPLPSETLFTLSFYFHERQLGLSRGRSHRNFSRHKLPKTTVNLYDVSCLFPVQKDLAEKYLFDSNDVVGMCLKNGSLACSVGRTDLEETWGLAALAAASPPQSPHHRDSDDLPWPRHPLSLEMIHSMIDYYAGIHDIQTAAMLCCAFGTKTSLPKEPEHRVSSNKSLSPEPVSSSSRHTIHQMEGSLGGWKMSNRKLTRSNSWSNIFEESAKIVEHTPLKECPSKEDVGRIHLEHCELYDLYKLAYAEILESWQLLHARAQVMKYVSSVAGSHKGLDRISECLTCKVPSVKANCESCRKPLLKCIICRTPVRGLANSCILCNHGGHLEHLQSWFSKHAFCPTGCGCHCMLQDSSTV